MKIIKRSGEEVGFDITKIIAAVHKANKEVEPSDRLTTEQIQEISRKVEEICKKSIRAMNVEEIQDAVEYQIMRQGAYHVAKAYITYRYKRQLVRQSNTTDAQIMTIIESQNEEAKQENSNKNPLLASTQRDYMAGEGSKERNFFLDAETNLDKWYALIDWPPYWLDATCAIICEATVQATENEFGRSIFVSLITVPFCSMSSRLTRQQL